MRAGVAIAALGLLAACHPVGIVGVTPRGHAAGAQPTVLSATGSGLSLAISTQLVSHGLPASYRLQFAGSDVAQVVAGIFDRTAPATTGFVESLGYFNDNGAGMSATNPLSSAAFTNLENALGTAGGPTIPATTVRSDARRWLFYRVTGATPHGVTLKQFPLPSSEHACTLFAAALDSYDSVIGFTEEDLTCCVTGDVITNTAGSNSAGMTVNLDYSSGAPHRLGTFRVSGEFVGNGYSDLLLGAFDTTTTPHFGFLGAGSALGSPSWLSALESAMAAKGYTDTANTRRYLIKDIANPTSFTVESATFANVPSLAGGAVFAVPYRSASAGSGQFANVSMASASVDTLANDISLTTSAVAGTGTMGFTGDTGPATSAEASDSDGVAVDTSGNLYFADYGNQRVRVVCGTTGSYFGQSMTAGDIYTIAGNGTPGYAGDGGAATSAELKNPRGVAVDASGNVYISDTGNNRVRKVTSGGIISTFAGNGSCCSLPGDGGAATSAELDNPAGIALDSTGDLVIADYATSSVRFVCATSGIYYGQTMTAGDIYNVAGNRTAGYTGDGAAATGAELDLPQGVVVDTAGDLFIADTTNNCVREVKSTGIISTLAGQGPASPGSADGVGAAAQFMSPRGVAVDSTGANVYVADSGNFLVRAIQVATAKVVTIAGTGATGMGTTPGYSTTVALNAPFGLVMSAGGALWVSDHYNNRIVGIQ